MPVLKIFLSKYNLLTPLKLETLGYGGGGWETGAIPFWEENTSNAASFTVNFLSLEKNK